MLADRVDALLADKGYDAETIREAFAKAGVEAVIPAKSNRRILIPHDREKYRRRNLVERFVQQTEELAPCRNPLRQDRRVLYWLRRSRISYALAPFFYGT